MSELTERGAVRAEFYHRAPRGEARTLEALRVLVIDGMADEIVRLRAAIERVRALHYSTRSYDYDEDASFCKECGGDYPCATLRALGGAP